MISIDPGVFAGQTAISLSALTRFQKRAAQKIGLLGTIDVLLTSNAELRRLNRQFRGKNKPTDILSFPAESFPELPDQISHAGDLAISVEIAAEQATAFGHPLETELRVLLLHGLLHLAGMDHENDDGAMQERENELRRELRLPTSLIERTLTGTDRAEGKPPAGSGQTAVPRASRGLRKTTSTRSGAATRREEV